ncbi:hypothetical protein E2I00_012288 [Balaenoptera physalus]|uniref:Uncharacterized protein n=1 Tax=Balaenoptera physalus TaxID=9770 RepID=A0A643C5H0_BALPH|nr:hypothetical protein E2I00_012288 [Balaenoptera physalus]
MKDGAGAAGHVHTQPHLADEVPQLPAVHDDVHDAQGHDEHGHQEVRHSQRTDQMAMITAEFSSMVRVVMSTRVMEMSIFSVMVLGLTATLASGVQAKTKKRGTCAINNSFFLTSRMAPAKKGAENKGRSTINKVVTREYTINVHKASVESVSRSVPLGHSKKS